MADNLKTTLDRVLQSRGRKTFAFAYATGKRKDGKGDGHLHVVAGAKTFKKDDLAEAIGTVGTFVQGKCWADSEGEAIFLQGKGLSTTVVAKMMLTAKKMTGKAFDLELPDSDEEKRQAILEAADGEAEKYRNPPTSTSEGVSARAAASEDEAAEESPAETKPAKNDAKPPASAAPYKALRAALQGPLEKLEDTDPAAAAKIQKIVTAAEGFAAKGDYDKAITFLKEAGKALTAAAAAEAEDGTDNDADPRIWKDAREKVVSEVKKMAGKIASSNHPEAGAAVKDIQSILKNLHPTPEPHQIDKLEAYINSNEILIAADELSAHLGGMKIREALVKALESLKQK